MKMNKLIGFSVIALSMVAGQAFASCTGGSDPQAPSSTNGRGGCLNVQQGNFLDQGFHYQLSNNVGAATGQSAVAFFVHTAHSKGLYSYGGTSNGGSVTACETSAVQGGFPSGVSTPATGTSDNGCS